MTSYCYKCQYFRNKEAKCSIDKHGKMPMLGEMRGCEAGRPVFRSEADYSLPEVSE